MPKRSTLSTSRRVLHALTPNNICPILPPGSKEIYPFDLRLPFPCKNPNSLLQLHARLVVSGHHGSHLTNTHLVKLYISFQRLDLAFLVFEKMPNPSVKLYNYMIRAYTKDKNHQEAIRMYKSMLSRGLKPDKYSFTFVLKACTGLLDFEEGVLVHRDIEARGLEGDAFIGTGLVDMYCKMGHLGLAREVFGRMPEKDVVAWNAMILGLSRCEEPSEAVRFVGKMRVAGVEPDLVSVLNLVPAVSQLGDVELCACVHGYAIRRGFVYVASNGLIDMYAKCGCVDAAYQVFEMMQEKDDVSWGTIMAGFANSGYFIEVLDLFDHMKQENVKLNVVSVVSALSAAAEIEDVGKGMEVHDCAKQLGLDLDVSVATAIVTLYAKCGDLEKARKLFQELDGRDLVAWSAIIAAFLQCGHPKEALALFRDMQYECVEVNEVTLKSVLPACAEVSSVRLGKSVHCLAVKANIDLNTSIGTALLSMYAKCGFFTSALSIFHRMHGKDVVTWNALISAYSQVGDHHRAMELYNELQLSHIEPDSGTMAVLLPACAFSCDIYNGSCIHGQVMKYGFEPDFLVKIALIDMYAKCGMLSSAESLFKRTECMKKDKVAWNVMIAGYLHNGHAKDAISAFRQMKLENLQPNVVTIVSVLPAAAYLSALRDGLALHACVIRMGFQYNTLVGNCLIDMYAKCGQLDYSEDIFHEMKNKTNVSWNVMLAAYAAHGQGNRAIELFSLMEESNNKVDSMSFISVLSACRHAGLVKEGRNIFYSVCKNHQIEPEMQHYACLVDLLGRAGFFEEILGLIKTMPMEPDAEVWGALLGACTIHSNVRLAELAMDHLAKIEPKNPTHFVVLSSIYAESGRWRDAGSTRSKIIKSGLKRTAGSSWI